MAGLAIAGRDVVVTIAKATSSAVDIPTAANAILTPFGMESLPHLLLRRSEQKTSSV
jgi:hypothetical protein